jgi:hypothetical protein
MVDHAVMNRSIETSLPSVLLGVYPKVGILGHVLIVFKILVLSYHFYSSCNIPTSHVRIPVSPHPQHLLFSVFTDNEYPYACEVIGILVWF